MGGRAAAPGQRWCGAVDIKSTHPPTSHKRGRRFSDSSSVVAFRKRPSIHRDVAVEAAPRAPRLTRTQNQEVCFPVSGGRFKPCSSPRRETGPQPGDRPQVTGTSRNHCTELTDYTARFARLQDGSSAASLGSGCPFPIGSLGIGFPIMRTLIGLSGRLLKGLVQPPLEGVPQIFQTLTRFEGA